MLEQTLTQGFAALGLRPDARAAERYRVYYEALERGNAVMNLLALKIAQPSMRLTLLDSLDKRVAFLRGTCAELGFDDVECVHARAEEQPEGFRESFDCAVSRAVARLNLLCELCLPYVRQGGQFLAMKGPEAEQEIREAYVALKTLGGEVERVFPYTIPGTEVTHCAVVIRKTGPTPKKYPRRWAQIKKKPL